MPGAGFFVAPGKVLTCGHVIGDRAALEVRWERDGRPALPVPVSRRATVLADRGRPIPALDGDYPDIAVLEVDGLDDHPCVEIDHEWPSSEDSFLVFGYPKEGGAVQLTPARLTYRATRGVAPTAYLDLASDIIKPGMSGAAVLNLRTGAVCGVVVASKHTAHPDGALAIPWSAIAADLGEVLDANRVFHLSDRRWDEAAAGIPWHKGRIVRYLETLIDRLNTDPWPQDQRFRGPLLTPAAIERKLLITRKDRAGEEILIQHLDADELTQKCQRLVVLGGPGSGKTWLARRAARRCAEVALESLAKGWSLDVVELPLFTTCSGMLKKPGDVRQAAVSSALDQLGDLGGSRLKASLCVFFTERNAPTLLVIDSLDEVHGSSERLRQADMLGWRIILTSRPSSWNSQLSIRDDLESHMVGELQPLRYPYDVVPFIERWFDTQPDMGRDLADQIARRPSLQQAATVPLILAFYCIIGSDGALPHLRHDLYCRVLNRMLTGRWRNTDNRQHDLAACLEKLEEWACSGAGRNSTSGVGMWTDDIETKTERLNKVDQKALDHVAPPLGLANVDDGKTVRRFVHRSIREYLVAKRVAGLPVSKAAKILLSHIWYDRDWEYSAPAAVAMHPRREKVLRQLINSVGRSANIYSYSSEATGGLEFLKFLARIANESDEADWSPDLAKVIGLARVQLASWGYASILDGAASWPSSTAKARFTLLSLLASYTDHLDPITVDGEVVLGRRGRQGPWADHVQGKATKILVGGVCQLASTSGGKRQARYALLRLLTREDSGLVAAELARGVAQLAPTADDLHEARNTLLNLLAGQTDETVAAAVIDELIRLAPDPEDRRVARNRLLNLLAGQTDGIVAAALARGVAELAPTADDLHEARNRLLNLLAGQTDGIVAAALARGVAELAPTADDLHEARGALLRLLYRQANSPYLFWLASQYPIEMPVDMLSGTPVSLADKSHDLSLGPVFWSMISDSVSDMATSLVGAMIGLEATAEDKEQARAALIRLLAFHVDSVLTTAAGEDTADPLLNIRRLSDDELLSLPTLEGLKGAVTVEEASLEQEENLSQQTVSLRFRYEAHGSIFSTLEKFAENTGISPSIMSPLAALQTGCAAAERLARSLSQLAPTAEDRQVARDLLLRLLADRIAGLGTEQLVGALVQLAPAAKDKLTARDALLLLLRNHAEGLMVERLAGALLQLTPTAKDKQAARDALSLSLGNHNGPVTASGLTSRLIQLDPTAEETHAARAGLLCLFAGGHDESVLTKLTTPLSQLDPTITDLDVLVNIGFWPGRDLLAAVRRNSTLGEWLINLPRLSDPQLRPALKDPIRTTSSTTGSGNTQAHP
jgi:hypothetical protein